MAELTPEQLKELLKKISDEDSKLRDIKIPSFTEEDAKNAKNILETLEKTSDTLEKLAESSSTFKKIQESIKDTYEDQYLYLTESEIKAEAAIRTRLATQKQLAEQIAAIEGQNAEIQAKALEEINALIEDATKAREDALGLELKHLQTLEEIQKEKEVSEEKNQRSAETNH